MEAESAHPRGSHQLLEEVLSDAPLETSRDAGEQDPDEYRIRIPNFEGPLDLLLHLIRKEQLNIYDIPVHTICKSYLEHLSVMQEFDVNIASEFMVMAATLMHLKSVMLLPQEKPDDETEDPRLPLVAQLLEYERIKKAAENLNERQWLYRDLFPRPETSLSDLIPKEALADGPIEPVECFQLLVCLKMALDRTTRPTYQVTTPEHISIRDTVTELVSQMHSTEVIGFHTLFPNSEQVKWAREIIRRFLAILELAKLKYIEIIQKETYGPIQIRPVKPMDDLNLSLLEQT